MRILVTDGMDKQAMAKLRELGHEVVEQFYEPDALGAALREFDAVVVRSKTKIRANHIDEAKGGKLKLIIRGGVGVDNIDVKYAEENGITVKNTPKASSESVAELALGMMLSLLRNVPQVEERCRAGKTKDGLVGTELRGKTVGIVGAGAIGQNTGRLCKAFGCKVIAYNHRPKQAAEGTIDEFVDLDTLTRESDIISLNCPLNDSTRGMFDFGRIAMMKKTAILINVARGPVVDSRALADALNEGRIAGAGIDVFETEPPLDVNHPLLHTPNTIVTPHVAFASKESMALRAQIVFDSLDSFLAGKQVNVIL